MGTGVDRVTDRTEQWKDSDSRRVCYDCPVQFKLMTWLRLCLDNAPESTDGVGQHQRDDKDTGDLCRVSLTQLVCLQFVAVNAT